MATFSNQKISFVAIFLLSIYQVSNAQFYYQECYEGFGTYSLLSDYGTNINESITQLASLASTSFYNTVSVGTGDDKVNALFSCRYDITSKACQTCVESTLERVPNCLQSVESVQFYDDCTLHYSNTTFFSIVEVLPRTTIRSRRIINGTEFSTLLSKTITTLINETVSGFSDLSRFFATAKVEYTSDETIYALAQCNAHLSLTGCDRCLTSRFDNFTGTYPGAYMGQIFTPSCRLSYKVTTESMSPPYDFTGKLAPSPPDGGSPPPPSNDKKLSPPPPSSIFDREPSSPTNFLDEAPPPPSPLSKSTGTRRMSTAVASILVVFLSFGLLI